MRQWPSIAARIAIWVVVAGAVTAAPAQFPQFVDVAPAMGVTLRNISGTDLKDYIVEANGAGVGFFDYDSDGDPDLLIANGSTLEKYLTGGDPMVALYRNDSSRFVDVTVEANLESRGWGMGVCIADYDNDGHRDFYLTTYGANVLYRNRGNRTFEDVTSQARVGTSGWSTNCSFGDYDRDGDVDLYVANYVAFDQETVPRRGETGVCQHMGADVFCGPTGLAGVPDILYRNNGDGTFDDVTVETGISGTAHNGFGVVFSDLDNDGWPDIYVANDATPNFLYRNNHDGTFSEIGLVSGVALNDGGREQAGMGVGVADYDGNGFLDIFVTNFSGELNTLYRNLGNMAFVDATLTAGLGSISLNYLGWGTAFRDLDNDGWPDIFVGNGHVYPQVDDLNIGKSYRQPIEVYRNLGEGRFESIGAEAGADLQAAKSTRGVAFSDFDNDGDIDVVAVNLDEGPSLYRNDGGNDLHWVSFRLEGVESNRDAIGARVEIEAGGRTQVAEVQSGGSFLSHNDMRIHFGLGEANVIDRIRIRWPSGEVDELTGLAADSFVTVREGQGR